MLLVNVNTKQFIPSAGSNFIQPVESRDQIIYGTRVEVRFQLYNPDGTVFALNESDVFCCAGDINFIHTDDLMFYSGHEMCRIIDAAQGIVGVTIDATSDSFAGKATSQNTRMHVQLKRHVAGDTLGDTVLQDIVYAQPAVMTTEGAPASSDPEYMTAAATLALLRTAPDYQFSVDGETNWHDQQDIAADRFYRERRNGGEWGPAIELIEGKTGAAAGFGTPTIAVETLPAGSDATASVAASGDNTAKVFNFNFGIPKGADGKNGTDGKAGADGVSSYTYVAYASDASGADFSLTPTNALKYRAEIHTTTAIETPDAEDFAGATWVKYIGDNGTGAGDMTKSVYDTNDDGIVDHAAVADTVGATAAAQVADAVGKAHTHANKATLDKLAETDGKLTFDGAEIGGGSGTVKSVNGQFPDESGNVTVETGGGMTARLVSGEVAASAGEWLVFTAAGSVTLPAGANLSEVKITAETAGVSVLPASGEAVAGDNGLSLDMPGYTVLLQFRETARNWVPVEITAARPSVLASSEEKPAIPDDGLVFYVPLESAEAATGQPISNNGVTFAPDAALGRDVAVFDGSANLSFTPTGMPSGTAPHTKSLWIKFNGDTGQVYALAWGSDGSDSASTITARNNKWAWCFAGDWEETDVDVPAGQWLNVTTTHSAGVNKLYVNGTLRNTHSRNLNISGNSGTIGSFLSGSEKITGALAALRVYDRVLTADEIAALAAEFTI